VPRHRHGVGQELQAKPGTAIVARQIDTAAAEVAAALSPPMASRRESMPIGGAVGGDPLQAGHTSSKGPEAGFRPSRYRSRTPRCRLPRQLATEHVMTVEIAEHPAAAMAKTSPGSLASSAADAGR